MALAEARGILNGMIQRYGDERQGANRPDGAAAFVGRAEHRDMMTRQRALVDMLENDAAAAAAPNAQVLQMGQALAAAIRGAVPGGAGGAAAAGAPGAGGMAPAPTRVKIQSFESGDGAEWRTWRDHIRLVIQEQGLLNLPDHDRAKRHVQMHIYNKAAALVRDVQPLSAADAAAAGEPEETLDEYLDRLQVRFLPVSAQLASRHAFEQCKQKTDETIGAFHARLISEFVLAYPHTQQPHTDEHLIRRFNFGLRDASVQMHVMQHQPEDYNDCLRLAEERHAVLGAVASCHRPGGGRINALEPEAADLMAAIDQRTATSGAMANKSLRNGEWPGAPVKNPDNKTCYVCNSAYHLKNACPVGRLQQRGAAPAASAPPQNDAIRALRKQKNRRGRGGAGRGRGGSGNRKVSALEMAEASAAAAPLNAAAQFISSMARADEAEGERAPNPQ